MECGTQRQPSRPRDTRASVLGGGESLFRRYCQLPGLFENGLSNSLDSCGAIQSQITCPYKMAVSSPSNHYMLLQSNNDLPVKKELILCSQCQSIHGLCYNRCMSLSLSVFIFSGIDTASHNRCRKIGLFTIKSLNRMLLGQPADKNRLQRQRTRHYTP